MSQIESMTETKSQRGVNPASEDQPDLNQVPQQDRGQATFENDSERWGIRGAPDLFDDGKHVRDGENSISDGNHTPPHISTLPELEQSSIYASSNEVVVDKGVSNSSDIETSSVGSQPTLETLKRVKRSPINDMSNEVYTEYLDLSNLKAAITIKDIAYNKRKTNTIDDALLKLESIGFEDIYKSDENYDCQDAVVAKNREEARVRKAKEAITLLHKKCAQLKKSILKIPEVKEVVKPIDSVVVVNKTDKSKEEREKTNKFEVLPEYESTSVSDSHVSELINTEVVPPAPSKVIRKFNPGYYHVKNEYDVYEHPDSKRPVTFKHLEGISSLLSVNDYNGCQCSDQGNGWFYVSDDAKKNVKKVNIISPVDVLEVVGYRWKDERGVWIDQVAQKFTVYTPLFAILNSKFKAAKLDQHLIDACVACSADHFHLISSNSLANSTPKYYFAHIHKRFCAIRDTDTNRKVTNNSQSIGVGDTGYMSRIHEYVFETDEHCPVQVPLDTYEFPADFTRREDFKFVQRRGCAGGDEKTPGSFPVFEECSKIQNAHSTRYTSYHTLPTKEYARNNVNMNAGLKRLIGAKTDEAELRGNALAFGVVLAVVASTLSSGLSFRGGSKVLKRIIGKRKYQPYNLETNLDKISGKEFEAARPPVFIANCAVQLLNTCQRSTIQRWIDTLSNATDWLYFSVYEQYLTQLQPYLSRETCALIAHVKRELRKRYVNGVRIHDDDDIMVQRIVAQLKRETAKTGKAPRVVASYGAGAMYANELPEFVKICINGVHTFTCNDTSTHADGFCYYGVVFTTFIMSKPSDEAISRAFKDLFESYNTPNFVYFLIYSDDGCAGGNVHGRSFWMEVDISSNDSSQDAPALLMSYLAMAGFSKKRAKGYVKQLFLPIVIENQEGEGSYAIQFEGPFFGSGTTITTIANHFGNFLNCCSAVWEMVHSKPLDFDPVASIVKGARRIGHTVTVAERTEFAKMTFLKRYPVRLGGGNTFTHAMCAGCMIRNAGTLEDDMQHTTLGVSFAKFTSMTYDQRFNMYMSAVVRGWIHEPSTPILVAFRDRFIDDNTNTIQREFQMIEVGTDRSKYDALESFLQRYDITSSDVEQLCECINATRVGKFWSARAAHRILKVDYDM